MESRRKLSEQEIDEAVAALPGWDVVEGKLHKLFRFDSFAQALGWMASVAIEAGKMDHHPEWCNVYNRVTVDLATHDLGDAISTWDVALAQKMEQLAGGNG